MDPTTGIVVIFFVLFLFYFVSFFLLVDYLGYHFNYLLDYGYFNYLLGCDYFNYYFLGYDYSNLVADYYSNYDRGEAYLGVVGFYYDLVHLEDYLPIFYGGLVATYLYYSNIGYLFPEYLPSLGTFLSVVLS